jgi:hypothetical protein
LGGTYESVGKKDSRWDEHVRLALDAAARYFSHVAEPGAGLDDIHAATQQAIEQQAAAGGTLLVFGQPWVGNGRGMEARTFVFDDHVNRCRKHEVARSAFRVHHRRS